MNTLPNLQRRGALALAAACLLPFSASAADDAQMRSIVDAAIRPVMAEYDVPGMAVAITLDGKTQFFNYGLASRESKTPVSETTLFEIGSISKTFTATLASYAQVQGKLSLDEHPSKYLPYLKGRPLDKATLRNLGTYTAGGLPLQFPEAVKTDEQAATYYGEWTADEPPGTQRRYSNPSIGLLAHITGLALKRDSADAMENDLFPKLGLKHSLVRVPPGAMANYAWGYDKDNKPIRMNQGAMFVGAYGVRSTATDMIRYLQVNIEPGKLDRTMQATIEGTHIPYYQVGEMAQGLGWEQYPYPISLERLLAGNASTMVSKPNAAKPLDPPRLPGGWTLFNKTGSTGGFSAYAVFVPEKKIGIVMLANKSYPVPARLKAAHSILEQLVPVPK